MKRTGKNITLTLLASLGLAAVVGSAAAYSITFGKVRGMVTQVVQTGEEAQLLAKKNEHVQTVRRIVRDTQEERMRLDGYFLIDDEIVSFLEKIEELGTHVGTPLIVQAVSVGKPIDKDERITPLNLSLKSEGSLEQIFYVLMLLEDFPKAVTVDTVQFSQKPDEGTWSARFNIIVLKINEPQ